MTKLTYTSVDSFQLAQKQRVYLPQDVHVHNIYKGRYSELKVSYESYRSVFNTEFNISFGYPTSDRCNHCDKYIADKNKLDHDRIAAKGEEATS
ncbi:hypothetical protein PR048_002115 [Dryococelus australis]|uniref:Uncharacterized protein n=1 Tax=Dryococelus australis TaxID=614101 RepID=A0ABQ9IKT0_9NEOP|nr:hypothetical protein PR048_002115 [Dryococelus australis]